jgi:hypothetical protein
VIEIYENRALLHYCLESCEFFSGGEMDYLHNIAPKTS